MIRERNLNKNFHWIDVEQPSESDFTLLSEKYGLPFLLVQDCLRPEHLPKFEETDSAGFLMLRGLDPGAAVDATTIQGLTRKIALFIHRNAHGNTLITIHRAPLAFLNSVEEKALKSTHPKSIDSLVHQVVLAVIRSYELPLNHLQEVYDEFEQEILANQALNLSMTKIYRFRRQLFLIKRLLKQSNDALLSFKSFGLKHSAQTQTMAQDLKENIDHLYFQFDEISDNFSQLFELHVALNDQRSNEVMKILTVFSSILLPLNFIASFYGMNFDRLPGKDEPYAVPVLVASMAAISGLAFWYFRRKGWFRTTRE